MNRVKLNKILYVIIIIFALGVIGCIANIMMPSMKIMFLIFITLALLIPGRVQGYYCKEFYLGKRLLKQDKYADCIKHFESFIEEIEKRRWIKMLMYFTWGIYTMDIEAMTYNNLGTAYLNLKNFDQAKEKFFHAIDLDEKYSIPYYNLAILSAIQQEFPEAETYYNKSKELGYSATGLDELIHKIQDLYADIQTD